MLLIDIIIEYRIDFKFYLLLLLLVIELILNAISYYY